MNHDPRPIIEGTDWSSLEHAQGPAEDTPVHLSRLLDEDAGVRSEALERLEETLLPGGALFGATAPAALFVAAILADPRALGRWKSPHPWYDLRHPFRARLLEWLDDMAESTHRSDPDRPGATAACRAARPAVHDAVSPYIDDPDPVVREAALGAACALLKAPDLAGRRQAAAARVRQVLAACDDRRERAVAIIALGQWGHDTTPQLADPDPAVRACAALSPGLAGNPQATGVLMDALQDPPAADAWFTVPPPQFDGWFRFALLAALLERTATFEDVLPAALAVARITSDFTVDRDWGPLLAKAFPRPYVPGDPLTAAQRAFLSALARNFGCFRDDIPDRLPWLDAAGLPATRPAVQALLDSAP
ncbi:HEAT repeat domain-containing protein [Actinomadura viridis]|uniref:HEAT repeat domain-containing protein n=1 Tax=Actinomadura viridis TaxID=58110 RepID=UPI003683CBCE